MVAILRRMGGTPFSRNYFYLNINLLKHIVAERHQVGYEYENSNFSPRKVTRTLQSLLSDVTRSHLTLNVYDEDKFGADTFLGSIEFNLVRLRTSHLEVHPTIASSWRLTFTVHFA